MASIATGNIAGIKTVKGLGLEKLESKKFEESNSRLLDIGVSMARRRAILTNANALIFGLATSTILLYGGFAALRGEISVGDLVAFTSYMAMLMWPLSMLGLIIANIQTVSVSARRIFELIESGIEEDDDNCVELNNVSGEVVFENVSFGYTENSPLFREELGNGYRYQQHVKPLEATDNRIFIAMAKRGWLVKSVDTIAQCVHEEGGEAVRVSVEVVVLVVYISTTATAIYFSGMWKRIRCKGS